MGLPRNSPPPIRESSICSYLAVSRSQSRAFHRGLATRIERRMTNRYEGIRSRLDIDHRYRTSIPLRCRARHCSTAPSISPHPPTLEFEPGHDSASRSALSMSPTARSLSAPSLFACLHRLEGEGLVRTEWSTDRGRRIKTYAL